MAKSVRIFSASRPCWSVQLKARVLSVARPMQRGRSEVGGGEIGAERLEVAALVSTGADRTGRRHDISGDAHARKLPAQLLEDVSAVAGGQL